MAKLSFKDSLKALEADIQHANTLALDYPREKDGARVQIRLSYSPAAQFFLFLVQWTDCHLAGALGLLRVLIYMTYADGKTTMSVYERKASIREFYAVIFPSLLQLQRGITDLEDRKQKEVCNMRYRKKDESEKCELSEIEIEREEECGICMEMNSMVVLPNCTHSLCIKCYRDWRGRSQSCPFCRDSLKRVDSGELWMFLDQTDAVNITAIARENHKRLFLYIEKLPLVVPDQAYASSPHDCHVRCRRKLGLVKLYLYIGESFKFGEMERLLCICIRVSTSSSSLSLSFYHYLGKVPLTTCLLCIWLWFPTILYASKLIHI